MKVFICYRNVGNGVVVVAANSEEEAFGTMVKYDDGLKYVYSVDEFTEIENLTYHGKTPELIAEGGRD